VDYQKRIYCILNEETSDFAQYLLLNYGEDEPLQLLMESPGDGSRASLVSGMNFSRVKMEKSLFW
jgi:hypothetical protein